MMQTNHKRPDKRKNKAKGKQIFPIFPNSTSKNGQPKYISSCLYSQDEPVECCLMSFDIDVSLSDPALLKFKGGQKLLDAVKVRKKIKHHYPELLPMINYITRCQTGLSLVFSLPSFSISDMKISRIFNDVQIRLGKMLSAIGVGCDPSAYGMIRNIPNYRDHERQLYVNRSRCGTSQFVRHKVKIDGKLTPVVPRLLQLCEVTKKYKPKWDETKKANAGSYFAVDPALESKLASFYLRYHETEGLYYRSQAEIGKAIDICVITVRKLIKTPFNDLITFIPQEHGYIVQFKTDEKMLTRAKKLISKKGREGLKDKSPALTPLPSATEVLDGHRNNYAWRLMVQLRESGLSLAEAREIAKLMLQKMPDSDTSKTVGHLPHIAKSIYKKRPMAFKVRGFSMDAAQIIGFNEAREALKTGSGKKNGGREGGEHYVNQSKPTIFNSGNLALALDNQLQVQETKELDRYLSIVPSHYEPLLDDKKQIIPQKTHHKSPLKKGQTLIDRLQPTPYRIWATNNREIEIVSDSYQRNLQKIINQSILAPSVNRLVHENLFSYIQGRSHVQFKALEEKYFEVHQNSIRFDIQKFYNNIDQSILRKKLSLIMDLKSSDAICDSAFADKIIDGNRVKRERGIPQGSPLSNSLANLYLTDFDHWLDCQGVDFIRYCDDVVIFHRDMKTLESVFEKVQFQLELLGLWINPLKTIRKARSC